MTRQTCPWEHGVPVCVPGPVTHTDSGTFWRHSQEPPVLSFSSSPPSLLSSIHYPSAVLLPSSSPWIDVFLMVDSGDGWMGAEAHCWLRRKVHCGQLNPHVSGSCRVAINNRGWGQIIHNFCPWPQPLHLQFPSSKSWCTLAIITTKDSERER